MAPSDLPKYNPGNSDLLMRERKPIAEQPLRQGAEWVICGFLRSIKKMGKLNFAIVVDASAQIQILLKSPLTCRKESVILARGRLIERKSPNLKIPLGKWELEVSSYEIISEATKPLPFELSEIVDEASEAIRLKYRYLDLRRNGCRYLNQKSQIMNSLRAGLLANSFVEVNTPTLSISSKEGANTFDTHVMRNNRSAKFSLAQSPQLYKQLLMMSGLERYFQFANCFRLEDLRADRQYEFLQLDIEMAYSNQEELFSIIESLVVGVFSSVFKRKLNVPFRRLSYDESLEKYGSDKPDTRYGLEIEKLELNELAEFNSHTEAYGFYLENCSVYVVEQKWLKSLQTKNPIYIVHVEKGRIVQAHLMREDMPEYLGKGLEKGREFPIFSDDYSGV